MKVYIIIAACSVAVLSSGFVAGIEAATSATKALYICVPK